MATQRLKEAKIGGTGRFGDHHVTAVCILCAWLLSDHTRWLKLMVQFHPKPHHGWRTLHESFETLLTVQDLKKRRKKRFDQYSLHVWRASWLHICAYHEISTCKSMNWQAISRGKKDFKSSRRTFIPMDGVRLSGKDKQCTYSYLTVNSSYKIRIFC
jgi:hypothetical protein